jgi:DNA-binding NtrC family response regulator
MLADATVTPRALIVDDEEDVCEALRWTLEPLGYDVTAVHTAAAALTKLGEKDFDVVLTDLCMPGMGGLDLCERILRTKPDIPVLVVTGQGDLASAISAMRAGAYDFLTKPVQPQLLLHAVARAVQHGRLGDEVRRLRVAVSTESPTPGVLGESRTMRGVFELISRIADTDTSVLIQGETGTGKELIARAIHASSPRKAGPFVALNCAAVPASLLESELFGHAKGAFTDAKSQRTGLFVQANGGTLFLDEIGELSLEMQPKLLRALQERTVRPVGSNSELPFDVRLVTATNRDLEYETFEKRFREDLFYRVNVVKIELPPLRDRGGDVLLLAQHFLSKYGKRAGKETLVLEQLSAEKLMAYAWPGNVRELENCMERAVALARYNQLTVDDLPQKIRDHRPDRVVLSVEDIGQVMTLDELDRRYITQVLAIVGDNKSKAAELLGLDRRTLYRRLERYEDEHKAAASARPAQLV